MFLSPKIDKEIKKRKRTRRINSYNMGMLLFSSLNKGHTAVWGCYTIINHLPSCRTGTEPRYLNANYLNTIYEMLPKRTEDASALHAL